MEFLNNILPIIQLILSLLLIAAILLQQSGASVGGSFGGGSEAGNFYTRRGLEKFLFYATIVLGILFALTAFIALIL